VSIDANPRLLLGRPYSFWVVISSLLGMLACRG
jgi:hypothetical protein